MTAESRHAPPARLVGGRSVGPVGLGGAWWSFVDEPDPDAVRGVIHAALDAGITLLDTARAYTTLDHPSHNEWLVARALADHPLRDDVLVVTKGGHYRSGPAEFAIDARPQALRAAIDLSLTTLGVERLGLYLLHWPDPAVPLEESVGAMEEARLAGKIAMIGVSNVSLEQYERARSVAPIAAVQNDFSPFVPGDRAVLERCTDDGVAYLAYTPLGGARRGESLAAAFPAIGRAAAAHGVSVQRVALAWLLARSPRLVPIIGSSTPAHVRDSAAAPSTALTHEEHAAITADVDSRAARHRDAREDH